MAVKEHGLNAKSKLAATALSVLLLVTVLFSALFPAMEANHHCHGEDCPICSCIAMCEKTLRVLGDGGILLVFAVFHVLFLALSVSSAVKDSLVQTLVSRKVRLNN